MPQDYEGGLIRVIALIRRISMKILLASLIIPVILFSKPGFGQEEDSRWEIYFEYLDRARRMIFTCYYDPTRIISSADSVRAWVKIVPSLFAGEKPDKVNQNVPSEKRAIYEIRCQEKEYRTIESYAHYEDTIGYNTTPSAWRSTRLDRGLDNLLEFVCVPTPEQ
jgi:hypothetical protein